MPVYEYKCKMCDEQFEIEQSFTDETLTSLDGCEVDESKQHQLKKVFRAVGISFKGDGFYRNDARSGSSSTGSAAKTDGSTKSESSSSTSDSSDSPSSSSSSSDTSSSSSSGSEKSSTKKDTSTASKS